MRAYLRRLHSLASFLAARWDELDREARLRAVADVGLVAAELGRLTRRSAPAGSSGRTAVRESFPHLTPRELQVLSSLASGQSTLEIAESLGITTATVRSHVKSLLEKLGAHSRVEAIALSLAHLIASGRVEPDRK